MLIKCGETHCTKDPGSNWRKWLVPGRTDLWSARGRQVALACPPSGVFSHLTRSDPVSDRWSSDPHKDPVPAVKNLGGFFASDDVPDSVFFPHFGGFYHFQTELNPFWDFKSSAWNEDVVSSRGIAWSVPAHTSELHAHCRHECGIAGEQCRSLIGTFRMDLELIRTANGIGRKRLSYRQLSHLHYQVSLSNCTRIKALNTSFA